MSTTQPAAAPKAGLVRHRFAFAGAIALTLATLVALTAPILAPHDPIEINAVDRLKPIGDATYPLGTDRLGRDVASRLVYGSRISLGVGLATVILSNLAGITIGMVSGYYRALDNVLMRVMDAFMAFPGILLALGIMAVLGPSIANIVIALSIVYTPRVARVVRSSVLSIREMDYVEAARALGGGDGRLIFRHILPNCVAPIVVQGTFIFAYAVISEASLSFLGVGSSPEVPSWGNMLAEARQYLRSEPMLAILPGVAIMIVVLSLNLLGDGLRDILDPYMRDARGAE
jgi:peptide/nickel transport system permease protein